jgi:hypothetical protein
MFKNAPFRLPGVVLYIKSVTEIGTVRSPSVGLSPLKEPEIEPARLFESQVPATASTQLIAINAKQAKPTIKRFIQ